MKSPRDKDGWLLEVLCQGSSGAGLSCFLGAGVGP